MKLKKLIKDIPIKQVKGSKDLVITGICANSKLVAPGNLFIARKGRVDDGALFIPEALSAGAVAILSDIYDPALKEITQLIHPDVTAMESLLAAQYYQNPSDELFMVGITGTNGKTTTSFLIKHLLDKITGPCGLIGTIEYIIGQHRYQATRTTPDISTNQKMLREMVIQGCTSAVMEVTSHALDQGRVQNIHFDVAVFSNLTVDHLDYHHTMENYCIAKNKLFRSLVPYHGAKSNKPYEKTAVINLDSPWHAKILEGCRARVFSYGIDQPADLQAKRIVMQPYGTQIVLHYLGKEYECTSPLVGRYNVYNVLSAISTLLTRKYTIEQIIPHIATFKSVSGRLEPVSNTLGINIYVDFAHSDDALTNVLECLKEIKKGRIITVFGCGGDRDQSKRPRMAEASEELSDFTIVTTDNPRSEEPVEIVRQIVQGFKHKSSHTIEIDRYTAIEKAITMAEKDDIILIAGKGHEPYQIFDHKIIEFDDRKVAFQIASDLSEKRKQK